MLNYKSTSNADIILDKSLCLQFNEWLPDKYTILLSNESYSQYQLSTETFRHKTTISSSTYRVSTPNLLYIDFNHTCSMRGILPNEEIANEFVRDEAKNGVREK